LLVVFLGFHSFRLARSAPRLQLSLSLHRFESGIQSLLVGIEPGFVPELRLSTYASYFASSE
jgi:hypothetical protein